MNHWPFIIAAYAITIVGTVGVLAASIIRMRRAEARADALSRRD
jgi:hypothetical protein